MEKSISCCGCACSECRYYPRDCEGCAKAGGKVFWLEYTGEQICEIYDCCVNTKLLAHCGECESLPCRRFDGVDPTKTAEENAEDIRKQLEQLKRMPK